MRRRKETKEGEYYGRKADRDLEQDRVQSEKLQAGPGAYPGRAGKQAAGIHQNYICSLEKGKCNPTVEKIWKISKILDVSMETILRETEDAVED